MTIWQRLSDLIVKALDAYQKSKKKTEPTPVPTPVPVPTPPPAPVVVTGDLEDPAGYTEASVSANAHYEECHIEPSTGLLIRYAVYRPSCRGWWMLSSLGEGHVRLEGSKSNGTLIAENFTKNGQNIEVLGFADYEMHNGDTPENIRFITKGNKTPYNHTRRYIIAVCHKAPNAGLILFGYCVIVAAVAITTALGVGLHKQNKSRTQSPQTNAIERIVQ
ncbi:MAG: hypothetical protein WCS52_01860 [bacterium]